MSDPVAMYVGELIRDGHRQGFLFRAPGLQFIFPIRNPRTGMPAWQKRFRIIRPGTTDSDRELKEMTSVTHRDDYFILEYKYTKLVFIMYKYLKNFKQILFNSLTLRKATSPHIFPVKFLVCKGICSFFNIMPLQSLKLKQQSLMQV